MNRNLSCVVLTVAFVVSGVVMAEAPGSTLRVYAVQANPTGETRETINVPGVGTVATTLEADSATGIGARYEFRRSDLIGIELGIDIVDFDFTLAGGGVSVDFGSALFVPLTAGVNFHVLHGKRVGLHVGPVASYNSWGNLESSMGSAETDSEFSFGVNLGLDIPVRPRGWSFHAGATYLKAGAGDDSLTVDVDPLSVRVGLGYSF